MIPIWLAIVVWGVSCTVVAIATRQMIVNECLAAFARGVLREWLAGQDNAER
jgi:hypothetical protein